MDAAVEGLLQDGGGLLGRLKLTGVQGIYHRAVAQSVGPPPSYKDGRYKHKHVLEFDDGEEGAEQASDGEGNAAG